MGCTRLKKSVYLKSRCHGVSCGLSGQKAPSFPSLFLKMPLKNSLQPARALSHHMSSPQALLWQVLVPTWNCPEACTEHQQCWPQLGLQSFLPCAGAASAHRSYTSGRTVQPLPSSPWRQNQATWEPGKDPSFADGDSLG